MIYDLTYINVVDGKLARLLKSSKDLENIIESQRPLPTVVSTSAEDQNKDTSTSEDVASPNPPKPFVKFVKPKDSQPESKSKEQETPKKSQVKYAEQNRHSNKRPKGNQRNWNNLKSYHLGYNAIPPPAADLYLSPKKDLSWTGLPEFVDDTVTDYSRPSPTVASTSAEDQNKDTSTYEDVASTNPSKPFVKFVKPKDSQPESKSKEQETPKKSQVKYPEQNRHSNKRPKG
nr:hypothetical protein [Tanacetum cinerariifolium]